LPEKELEVGLAYLKSIYDADYLKPLWSYFEKQWLKKVSPKIWQITPAKEVLVTRTNNPLERYHQELQKHLKDHPGILPFIKYIKDDAYKFYLQRSKIRDGDEMEVSRFNTWKMPKIPMGYYSFRDKLEDSKREEENKEEISQDETVLCSSSEGKAKRKRKNDDILGELKKKEFQQTN